MSSPERLPRATTLAHNLIRTRLLPADHAIDATVGNGYDTAFLAKCVGERGKVIGFDIQDSAIKQTSERCSEFPQVQLHQIGHENLLDQVSEPVRAVMFNLGYLPSGEKEVITRPETTLKAMEAALQLLVPGGILTAVVYQGHPGGAEEAAAIENWSAQLEQEDFSVAKYGFLNQQNSPPYLIVVEKRN